MNESLKLYKTLVLIFLCIFIVLGYMIFNTIKSRDSNKSNLISNNFTTFDIKKFGYSDILKIIDMNTDLQIANINTSIENKDFIKLELKFNSSAKDLYHTLEKLKSEACFISVDNIIIDQIEDNTENISFTATFLKTK